MLRDALRTLVVVSERPHPWAFLRDRLDPDLVTVAWARPGDPAALAVTPWLLAGDGCGRVPGLAHLRGRLLACRWVGRPPVELPVTPVLRPDWRAVAADAEQALNATVAGLRLAPGSGLVLPDGSFVARAPELEALLSAHPDGLSAAGLGRRRAVRRAQALLERHRLPLRVACAAGSLRLTALDVRPEIGQASDGRPA
ncbi:MAG TPA: hypothetical protein VKF59_15805 [Candidatus Dormibacteraeota bacterium]|nr:hypothetical protein [Candidatus Dormibacteraeota bacterium]